MGYWCIEGDNLNNGFCKDVKGYFVDPCNTLYPWGGADNLSQRLLSQSEIRPNMDTKKEPCITKDEGSRLTLINQFGKG